MFAYAEMNTSPCLLQQKAIPFANITTNQPHQASLQECALHATTPLARPLGELSALAD